MFIQLIYIHIYFKSNRWCLKLRMVARTKSRPDSLLMLLGVMLPVVALTRHWMMLVVVLSPCVQVLFSPEPGPAWDRSLSLSDSDLSRELPSVELGWGVTKIGFFETSKEVLKVLCQPNVNDEYRRALWSLVSFGLNLLEWMQWRYWGL